VGVIGLFLVEARRGRLAAFAFQKVDGKNEDEARTRLLASLTDAWAQLKNGLMSRARTISGAAPDDVELIDLDDPSTSTRGLAQPVFFERLRPEYTMEAQLANITATVEIEAVFSRTGKVTDLEIVKWAGFGLDESALQTVARLRFKPAERNGQPISVRALVRYNFKG
jgi:TonB family protein